MVPKHVIIIGFYQAAANCARERDLSPREWTPAIDAYSLIKALRGHDPETVEAVEVHGSWHAMTAEASAMLRAFKALGS
jgi:hypothetical protein